MIAECGPALDALADRYFKAETPQSAVDSAGAKPPSRHEALVKAGVASCRDGRRGMELRSALLATNADFESPKPADEVEAIAQWCEREVEATSMDLVAIDAAALLAMPFEEPRFIVRPVIPERALVLVSGDTGAGKTALILHMVIATAIGTIACGLFGTAAGLRVLYVNGEMGSATFARYVREAAAGLGCAVPPGRLFFEGADGVATFHFRTGREALERLVSQIQPALIIFDTMRALLIGDENESAESREIDRWIRSRLINQYGASVIMSHHLRKMGAVSNGERERVAGSRDLIAIADVHLACKARDGAPLHALKLDKTRMPVDGVAAGTEWPIEARLEPGGPGLPNQSTFLASAPSDAAKEASSRSEATSEICSRLDAEGALTLTELQVQGGTRKRAWERLRKDGVVVEAGKRGRKVLYRLAISDDGSEAA